MCEEKRRRPAIKALRVVFRPGEHIDLAEFRFGKLQEESENTISHISFDFVFDREENAAAIKRIARGFGR